jgi:hypothetical protein
MCLYGREQVSCWHVDEIGRCSVVLEIVSGGTLSHSSTGIISLPLERCLEQYYERRDAYAMRPCSPFLQRRSPSSLNVRCSPLGGHGGCLFEGAELFQLAGPTKSGLRLAFLSVHFGFSTDLFVCAHYLFITYMYFLPTDALQYVRTVRAKLSCRSTP